MTAVPTGVCYCGCGESVGRGSLFKIGHDKKATSILDAMRHGGSVADRILAHGYGPGQRSLRAEGLNCGSYRDVRPPRLQRGPHGRQRGSSSTPPLSRLTGQGHEKGSPNVSAADHRTGHGA